MHNRDKYPEIWAAKESAEAKLAPLMAKRAKNMVAMNKVADKIQALRAEKGACHDKACSDWEEINQLRKEVSRLAKAMGAVSA